MNEKDVVDIFFKLLDGTAFYWNFYVAGVAIIIGWILTTTIHPSRHVKILVSLAFGFFVVMNLSALFGRLAFIDLFSEELKALIEPCALKTPELCARIHELSFKNSRWVALGVHAIVDVSLFFLIWSDKAWRVSQREET